MAKDKDMFVYEVEKGVEMIVPNVPKDPEDWLISKEEKYVPDKDRYVLNQFKKDYPDVDIDIRKTPGGEVDEDAQVQLIYSLSSRSTSLTNWLSKVTLAYSRSATVPTFFADMVTPEDYETISNTLIDMSKLEANRANDLNEAATEYKARVKKINEKYDKQVDEKITTSKIKTPIKIISLNTTVLPLTLQIAIEKFTPAKDGPTRKQYAREVLVTFKRSLLSLYKILGDKLDMNVLIDKIAPK